MLAAGLFAATSCSDFSDYNEVPVDAVASGNQTLWENIKSHPQLKDFAALVSRTGFNANLMESRAFTVWAPVDGSYNAEEFRALSDSLLLQQFVKNHVAEYTFGANGLVDKRVHTINKKSYSFVGNGSYTFDGIAVSQPNLPNSNGVMHLMDGVAKFYPNLFEYMNMADNISSLRDYFMQYNDTTLSSESVKGPMVNGVQTYLDSVLVVTNSLTRNLNARIENEDSSYTFLMPTDNAYQMLYNRIRPFYNFINTTKVQDVEQFAMASSTNSKQVSVDAAYLADSLTRRAISRNLIFSNNDAYNLRSIMGIRPANDIMKADTLRSTTRNKFSNPEDLLKKYMVGEPQELSNGYARLVDSLAFYPWETYNPEISVNPHTYLAKSFTSTVHNRTMPDSLVERVFGPETGITNFRYSWIEPNSSFARPDFFISLPGVMSATYNFYVVFLPSAWREFGGDERPSKLNFQLSYCNTSGNLATYNFSKANAEIQLAGGEVSNKNTGATTVNATTAFENDPQKTDTIFIGRFTFPVAYNGLGDYMPNIRVTTPINPLFAAQTAVNTRDVRIAKIILKPVEYDEFEANNK